MSAPLIEQIAAYIKTAIDGITTANSYNQNLKGIRPKRSDFQQAAWNDLDVIISQMEANEEDGGTYTKQWRQFFLLSAIVVDSSNSTDPIDTRCNQVAADIEKKILAVPQMGGLAIDTNIHAKTPFKDDEAALSGIAIQISVVYRTKENDPYTQA